MYHSGFMIIALLGMGLSMLVGGMLRRKFTKYSKIPAANGWTGKETAERMLAECGVFDVQVISVSGQLTDHYNPTKKTVNLSEAVYNQRSAAAQAVAAHECGHALQHAKNYAWLQFRTKLVPVQKVSGMLMNFIVIAAGVGGYALSNAFPTTLFLWIAVLANAGVAAFALVTLPVEFDASKRALAWMKDRGHLEGNEYFMAKDALKAAALTYVAAALTAVAQLLYFVVQLLNSRR